MSGSSGMSDPIQARSSDPRLRDRYGIKSKRFPSWLTYAILIGIFGGGWLLWSASHFSKPAIRSNLISFNALDSHGIEIRYQVQFRDLNKAHRCRLVARDYGANVVGELTEEFPAGTPSQTKITLIPTRALAVNAGINSCQTL
jgi:hypothetical protein